MCAGSRRRNSWHDAIACYAIAAIIAADDTPAYSIPTRVNQDEPPNPTTSEAAFSATQSRARAALPALLRRMTDDYAAPNGLLVHQPAMRTDLPPDLQVQFSCTQAIWGAVGRMSARLLAPRAPDDSNSSADSSEIAEIFAEHRSAWIAFCEARSDDGGLLPVANVYPDARLWCNAEPAAWLLLERSDFAPSPRLADATRVF